MKVLRGEYYNVFYGFLLSCSAKHYPNEAHILPLI